MQDETLRLQSKLHKLEDVLEKQRWTQKEQALKFEKSLRKLEQDLEEQKFQAQYNREQVQRYQSVLNNLAEGIYAADADGNVFAMNDQARQLLDEDSVTPILLEATAGDSVLMKVETQWPGRFAPDDKPPCMVTVEARPIRDEQGKIVGSVAVMRIE